MSTYERKEGRKDSWVDRRKARRKSREDREGWASRVIGKWKRGSFLRIGKGRRVGGMKKKIRRRERCENSRKD